MGIDHNWSPYGPPHTWQTMIFGRDHDDYQWRYSAREQAFAHHDQVAPRFAKGRRSGDFG